MTYSFSVFTDSHGDSVGNESGGDFLSVYYCKPTTRAAPGTQETLNMVCVCGEKSTMVQHLYVRHTYIIFPNKDIFIYI